MTDPEHTLKDESNEKADDPEDLADAYEALEEDRRQQAILTSTDPHTDPDSPGNLLTVEHAEAESPSEVVDGPVETQADEHAAAEPARRVFLIDGKEYPDPDQSLPITGARSVQSMYRDYFPGQLDNADVLQKTRADGTLEVTFRRRIGTKGRASQSNARSRRPKTSGEVVLDVNRVMLTRKSTLRCPSTHSDAPLKCWSANKQHRLQSSSGPLPRLLPAAHHHLSSGPTRGRLATASRKWRCGGGKCWLARRRTGAQGGCKNCAKRYRP